jgi:hypothetical protein
MARIVDLLVGLNAVLGLATFLGVKFVRRRRESNLEHVLKLEEENEQIDLANERMLRRGSRQGRNTKK